MMTLKPRIKNRESQIPRAFALIELLVVIALLLTATLQALPTLEFATSGVEANELLFYGNVSNENDGFAYVFLLGMSALALSRRRINKVASNIGFGNRGRVRKENERKLCSLT